MDCEGSEYGIIDSIESSYLKFNINRILLEYHTFNSEHRIMYNKMIEKIKKCGFTIKNCNPEGSDFGLLACWK